MLLGVAGLLLMAFCSALSPDPTPEQQAARAASDAEFNMRVESDMALKTQLRDPESAEIEKQVVTKSGVRTVCGTVNARNGFGGYTGPQPYMGLGNGSLVMVETRENRREFNKLWNERCAGG